MSSMADIRRRKALLKIWLDPQADGEGAGRLAGQPYRAIAQALRQEFPGQEISERSLQRYLKELRKREPGLKLQTLGRGRRRAERTDAVAAVEARRSKVALAAARREVEVGIWCELLSLTGLPRTHLHAQLRESHAGGLGLPSLSTFMARLKHVQTADLDPAVAERVAGLDREEHVPRLHQVTLDGPDGELRVVALAYDPKTHYVNAQLIVLRPAERAPQRGRPLTRLATGEPPQVVLVEGKWQVRLAASWWRDFLVDTWHRTRLPVVGALWCPSLGPSQPLIDGLKALESSEDFLAVPGVAQGLMRDGFVQMSVDELRRSLTGALNCHNQKVARPLLQKRRLHIDEEMAFAAQTPDRKLKDEEKYGWLYDAFSPETAQERAELVRRATRGRQLKLYEELSPIAPHRGTYLSCQPQHWLVKGLRPPPEAAEPSDGVKPAFHTPPNAT